MNLYQHFDKYVNNYIKFGNNIDKLELKLEHSKNSFRYLCHFSQIT